VKLLHPLFDPTPTIRISAIAVRIVVSRPFGLSDFFNRIGQMRSFSVYEIRGDSLSWRSSGKCTSA